MLLWKDREDRSLDDIALLETAQIVVRNDVVNALFLRYPSPANRDKDILNISPESLHEFLGDLPREGIEIANWLGIETKDRNWLGIETKDRKKAQDKVASHRRAAEINLKQIGWPQSGGHCSYEHLQWIWLWTELLLLPPLHRGAWLLTGSSEVERRGYDLGRRVTGGPDTIGRLMSQAYSIPIQNSPSAPLATALEIAHGLLLTTDQDAPRALQRFVGLLGALCEQPHQGLPLSEKFKEELTPLRRRLEQKRAVKLVDELGRPSRALTEELFALLWTHGLPLADPVAAKILEVPVDRVAQLREEAWKRLHTRRMSFERRRQAYFA